LVDLTVARISEKVAIAAAHPGVLTAFHSIGLFDGLSN
jgi:hypothetical protein